MTQPADPGSQLPKLLEQHLAVSWKLYRTHFATLFPYYLLFSVPVLLVSSLQAGFVPEVEGLFDFVGSTTRSALWSLISGTLQFLPIGLVSAYIAKVVIGEPAEVSAATGTVGDKFLLLLLAGFLVNLATAIGTFFLVLPGIVAAIFLTFTAQAVILEKQTPFEALRTSYELTKPQFWRALGFVLVSVLIVAVPVGILSAIVGLITSVGTPDLAFGEFNSSLFVSGLLNGIAAVFGSLYTYIFTTLFYLSSKRRYGAGSTDKPPVSIREAEPVETDSTSPGVKE